MSTATPTASSMYIVKPRQVASPPTLALSVVDRVLPAFNITLCYVFKPEHATDVTLLEQSLEALVSSRSFAPFAGSFDTTTAPPARVLCDGHGIKFRTSQVDNCTAQHVLDLAVPAEAWDTIFGDWRPDVPNPTGAFITQVHVARLADGAQFLIVSVDHRMADIFGVQLFVNSWARLARYMHANKTTSGGDDSDFFRNIDDVVSRVAPVNQDRSALNPTAEEATAYAAKHGTSAATTPPTQTHGMWMLPHAALAGGQPPLPQCRAIRVRLSVDQLNKLQARAQAAAAAAQASSAAASTSSSSSSPVPHLTHYDAASAWLWALVAHSRPQPNGSLVSWSFVVNGRFRAPHLYTNNALGNATFFAQVFAPSDTLTAHNPSRAVVSDHALATLALAVRAGVQSRTPEVLREAVCFMDTYLRNFVHSHVLLPPFSPFSATNFGLTSWWRTPMFDAAFVDESTRPLIVLPTFVGLTSSLPYCAVTLPIADDPGLVFLLALNMEEAARFDEVCARALAEL